MIYQATLRYARITPRKLSYVMDLVRGKNVGEARQILGLNTRRGAAFLIKLLKSAVANATVNPDVNEDNLYIKQALVEAGPVMKRWRTAPMGRGVPIKKRLSHAKIMLEEKK
jgi:large subunit ribosomal protein L22